MAISHVRWLRSGVPDADVVLAYAGRELARYIRRLTGERWDVRGASKIAPTSDTLWLGLCDRLPAPPDGPLTPAPWDDGYAIWQAQGGLFIAGRNARSVLFGVYAFLEQQGGALSPPRARRRGDPVPQADHLAGCPYHGRAALPSPRRLH